MKSRFICNQHNYVAQSHGPCLVYKVMDQKKGHLSHTTDGKMLQATVPWSEEPLRDHRKHNQDHMMLYWKKTLKEFGLDRHSG